MNTYRNYRINERTIVYKACEGCYRFFVKGLKPSRYNSATYMSNYYPTMREATRQAYIANKLFTREDQWA